MVSTSVMEGRKFSPVVRVEGVHLVSRPLLSSPCDIYKSCEQVRPQPYVSQGPLSPPPPCRRHFRPKVSRNRGRSEGGRSILVSGCFL